VSLIFLVAANGFRPQARQPIPFKFDPSAAAEAQVKPSTIAWLSYRDDPPQSSTPVPSPANVKSVGSMQENAKPGVGSVNVQAHASVGSRKPQLAIEQENAMVGNGKALAPPSITIPGVSGNQVVVTKTVKECEGEVGASGRAEGEQEKEMEKVEDQGEEDEEQEEMSTTSIVIEADPNDPTKYHIPLMEQFKLLQLGWTPPSSNSLGSPLLGDFGAQQPGKKQMTLLDSEAAMAIQPRALVHPGSPSPSPTPKFRKLIDISDQASDEEDLIQFPSDDEEGKAKQQASKPSDELRSLSNVADLCKCKHVSRTVEGLANSKWARPGYQHLGHFPKNTAILGHEDGCPVRVEFAKAHPLDCGANPATYHGQDAGVIYLRTPDDGRSGPQPPLKAFNAEAADFIPRKK